MPPKAKKTKKQIEEEKSKFIKTYWNGFNHSIYREARRRKKNLRRIRKKESRS